MDRHPLVEHEAIAVPVVPTNLLKVAQDATSCITLVNPASIMMALAFRSESRPCKTSPRVRLSCRRKTLDGLGKIPKRPDVKVNGVGRRPRATRNRFSCQARGRPHPVKEGLNRGVRSQAGEDGGVDVIQSHGDDFALLAHVQPVERRIPVARRCQNVRPRRGRP